MSNGHLQLQRGQNTKCSHQHFLTIAFLNHVDSCRYNQCCYLLL